MRIMINLINIEIFLQMTPLNYNLFKIQSLFSVKFIIDLFCKKKKKKEKKKK